MATSLVAIANRFYCQQVHRSSNVRSKAKILHRFGDGRYGVYFCTFSTRQWDRL